MTTRHLVACAMLFVCLFQSGNASAADPSPKPAKILFLTESKGFRHGSVNRDSYDLSPSEIAMTQLGRQTKLFKVHCTQNCEADFTKDNLKNYDIVMFYTTGVLPISGETRDYFLNDWLKKKGQGFIGFHSATDTYTSEAPGHWYHNLIGGTFKKHPWGSNNTVTITVHDPSFPAMLPFGTEFQFKDEIYEYINWKPENVHVLMSLNMAKCDPKMPYHVPVAWAKNWGEGKIFYNNLGHNEATWTNSQFLKSTEMAIRWIMNLESGDAKPNPEVSKAEEEKANAAAPAKK